MTLRFDGISQVLGAHRQAMACHLDECLVFVSISAEHHRQAGHALAADDPNFYRPRTIGDDRGEATLRKVDRSNAPMALLKHLPKRKCDWP